MGEGIAHTVGNWTIGLRVTPSTMDVSWISHNLFRASAATIAHGRKCTVPWHCSSACAMRCVSLMASLDGGGR